MIVECTVCHAKYNVDESKIPAAGVKVRCHKCQNIIIIKKEAPAPPVAPQPEPVPVEVTPPPPPVAKPAEPEPEPEPEPAPPPKTGVYVKPPEPEIITHPAAAPQPPPLEIETTAKPVAPAAAGVSEDDKKWHERARRLAKALASDLVLYNQDKVEQGLRDGTLVQLLGSEIRRSWEYYCQQIPKHIVDSSDYFKEQLNKIVGKGKELFK